MNAHPGLHIIWGSINNQSQWDLRGPHGLINRLCRYKCQSTHTTPQKLSWIFIQSIYNMSVQAGAFKITCYMTAELFKIQSSTSKWNLNFYKIKDSIFPHFIIFTFHVLIKCRFFKIKMTGIHKVYTYKTDCWR